MSIPSSTPHLTTATLPTGWDCHVHVFSATAPRLTGYYAPSEYPLSQIESLAAAHGCGHLVLVQPSVYGTDNQLLLNALAQTPGRHRGVVVVDASISDAKLDAMHAAGVRGIRVNRVSPVGAVGNDANDVLTLAPRLRERGWHVQWYVHAEQLSELVTHQQQTGLIYVLDHLASVPVGLPAHTPIWTALNALAAQGAWIKHSAPYRWPHANTATPTALHTHVQHLHKLFQQRVVWGSDWPHTLFAPHAIPNYAKLRPIDPKPLSQAALLYGG